MAEQQTNSIALAFQSLPENIRDWATSDSTMFSISEINTRLGLKEEKRRILPSLILRLITQNIDPQDFINELSYELNISFQTAKSIAQDIENSILKPIENELRKDVGVDVKLIYFGQPVARRPEAKFIIPNSQLPSSEIQKQAPPAPIAPSPLPISQTPKLETAPPPPSLPTLPKKIEPSVDLQSFEFKTEAPFILHQEGQYSTASSSELPKAKPSLNVKVQDYYQSEQEIKKPAPKPTAIKLETPQNRVVHYSGPTTKLNNLGLPKIPDQNTVDLRKFIKPPENGMNTVDLRQK